MLLRRTWRARRRTRQEANREWVTGAGWATLGLLAASAWLVPWYAIWVLPLAAVSGNRRLRAATLLFCAYAVLIHLPLAEGLLSPGRVLGVHVPTVVGRHRVDLTRFQVGDDPLLDLGR